jgi:transformation/transcription domain-associated protein
LSRLLKTLDHQNGNISSPPLSFLQVLDPCFTIRNSELTAKLCSVLEMVYQAYPSDTLSLPPEVKSIHTKVEDMLMKQLTNASNQPTNPAVDIKTLHTGLTTSLQILKILCPLQKSFVDKFVPAMVRIAQRFLKLMVDGAGLPNPKNNHQQDPQAVLQYNLVQATKTAGENLPWGNLKLSLRLASFRVLSLPQPRAVFLQMLPTILSETHVEASVRMEVLDIVKEWVEKPDSKASGNLKPPDVLALMTKLAQVDKSQFGKEMAAEWDGKLLKLLHRLCADGAHHSASLRQASLVSLEVLVCTHLPSYCIAFGLGVWFVLLIS